jgi:diguanylate cyclase (GGDEF)-like protein
MDSRHLLVIDESSEHAQTINSFLRNAGKSVQIDTASNYFDLESHIRDDTPFMIVVGPHLPSSLPIDQVLQMAEKSAIPVVIQISGDNTRTLLEAINTHAVQVISTEDNSQLIHLVEKQMSGGKSSRQIDDVSEKLDELQHRYDLLLDSARDSIAYIHEGLHVYANRAYLDLLQVGNLDDIEGMSLLEFMSTDEDTDLKSMLRDMNQDIFPDGIVDVTIQTPAGKSLSADLTFSPARFSGEHCIQMMVREKDANLVLQDELDRLRKTDQLTQMSNRQTFTEFLSAQIKEQNNDKRSSAVLYIEPDGMADLQQELGMQSIDAYILDLANFVRSCTEDDDVCARISDFGFAVLVRRNEKSELEGTAQCIIDNYTSHIIDLGDQTMTAACSVGMATLGSLTRNAEEVIAQAKKAFKEASSTGGIVSTYKPALKTVSTGDDERDWVERIRHALNNQDFYTVQQSIVDLEGENEGLFENRTFIREEGGDIAASEFMPIAERNDLGSTIDRHVIPQLMTAIAGTGDRHILPLSINSVLDFSFPNWFRRTLEETEVIGSQLILQISAITAESNLKATGRVIDELRELGCAVVLSEFDNDRRTIQLLEHLKVNMIKLRPGLAPGLASNTANQETVRAIVRAIAQHDITIVADEVKDAADLSVLWQCGVKLVTGDFLNEAPQVVGQ